MLLLVDDHIVDSGLGSRSCGGGQSDDGHRLVLCGSTSLQAYHVGKLRIVGHYAYSLGSIHAGATADGNDKVGARSGKGIHSLLDVRHGGVGLHLAVYLIGDAGLVQYVGHHLGYTKLHKTLVGHHQCFLQTQSMGYLGQLLACAGTEVGYFIQDKTVYHNCFSFD